MRRTLLTFALACLAVLGGCAASNAPSGYVLNPNAATGIVIVSIAHNESAGQGARAVVYYDTNGVPGTNRLQSGASFIQAPGREEALDGGAELYVLTVPAGRHSLDTWQMRDGAGVWVQPAAAPSPLVFRIAAGEVRYLGSVQATLQVRNVLGMKVLEGGSIEIVDRRERDIAAFERAYPQFKGKAEASLLPLGPWASPAGVELSHGREAPTPPNARR